jgi:hypothetical protein
MKPQRWSEVPTSWLERTIQSGCTTAIPRDEWLPFMSAGEHFTGAVGYKYEGPTFESSAQTTTPVVVRMDVERVDVKDALPHNYVRHFFIRAPDGRVLMSPPIKDVDYGHHRRDRAPGFDGA